MNEDHTSAIWVLGLGLVLFSAATSPYWHNVAGAVMTGTVQTGKTRQLITPASASLPGLRATVTPGSGLWLTLGTLVLVIILVAMAQASEGAGAFALVLLIGLWVLFLLGHTAGFNAFFSLFMPAKSASA